MTDAAFRSYRALRQAGRDVQNSSADGLILAPDRDKRILRKKLISGEGERPIVTQLFTSSPERMEKKRRILSAELGFDGFDINMGCPVAQVVE